MFDGPVEKGERVRFIAGKYGGKKGWINSAREPGDNTIPVIVDRGRKGEKSTYVYEENMKIEPSTPPSCYAEAVIQQCPDVEQLLVKMCRAFAKCDIQQDGEGFMRLVQQNITAATEWQDSKGSLAYYRKIEWDEDGELVDG